MTNWYELSDKNILNLMMIITRSSMNINMTAGKMTNMSVLTFGKVCFHNSFTEKYNFYIIYKEIYEIICHSR